MSPRCGGRDAAAAGNEVTFGDLFSSRFARSTLALLFMNLFGMFAWWGLFTWIPPYLSLPIEKGGRGFSVMNTTTLLVVLNLCGMFPGYAGFGWVADRMGRRRSFILYTLIAAVLVPLYAMAHNQTGLMILGALVAFFGTGFFSGSGIIASELFPTSVRARALGFTYNGARALSSAAPFVIGRIGERHGLDAAFYLCGFMFLLSGIVATLIPETLGRSLE
jgi:MFS family permease